MTPLELLENIRRGRDARTAKEKLYELVRSTLLARIAGKIPPRLKSRMDADDVLQTAFLRALGALEGFHPQAEDSFSAWVYSIAKNLIADHSRRRSVAAVRFAGSEDERGLRASQLVSERQRPESIILRREWIDNALSQLRAKEAEVIRLRWLEGCSFEEIAATWQKTPGAVQRFYSRAWQRFKEIAHAEDDDERGGA